MVSRRRVEGRTHRAEHKWHVLSYSSLLDGALPKMLPRRGQGQKIPECRVGGHGPQVFGMLRRLYPKGITAQSPGLALSAYPGCAPRTESTPTALRQDRDARIGS